MAGPVKTGNLPGGRPIVEAAVPLRSPTSPSQQIAFYGEIFTNPAENRAFAAFAGDTAPKVTGGYAKWQVLDRPQRIGLTTFDGYDPIQLTIPIRFTVLDQDGSWRTDFRAGERIEIDIASLEWMAGRETGAKKPTISGPSPRVWVTSSDGTGNPIPLIPFHFQPTGTGVNSKLKNYDTPAFVVTGLDWDEDALRNEQGYRIRQDAVVTLTQFIQDTVSGSAADRERLRNVKSTKGKTQTVHSAVGADTALLIAIKVGSSDHRKTAHAIVKANPKLKLRHTTQHIKIGTAVKVPIVT